MKRGRFLSALAAGGFAGAFGVARRLPAGALAQWRRRKRDEFCLIGIPGRCQGSRRENPWSGYHLEHMLG